MAKRDIIVIGASAGGIEALSRLFENLPKNTPASIFVVQHITPHGPDALPMILSNTTEMDVKNAEDGEKFERGVIYLAPPDNHLMIANGKLSVARGPKENLHRPSVDALFRSAAYAHGGRVISVILTGNMDDGSSGVWAVKACGGVCVAQDPGDAMYPDMPLNAIRYGNIDYVEPLNQIAPLLLRLLEGDAPEARNPDTPAEEVPVWEAAMKGRSDVTQFGAPSYFTCPSCSGTLWEFHEGDLVRYRCRTGHAFSLQSMVAEQDEALERALWIAIRTLDEKVDLMNRIATRSRESNAKSVTANIERQRKEASDTAKILRDLVKANGTKEPKD